MDYLDKHKRICAFVTAFLVTAVLLLSGFFIVTHIEHGVQVRIVLSARSFRNALLRSA